MIYEQLDEQAQVLTVEFAGSSFSFPDCHFAAGIDYVASGLAFLSQDVILQGLGLTHVLEAGIAHEQVRGLWLKAIGRCVPRFQMKRTQCHVFNVLNFCFGLVFLFEALLERIVEQTGSRKVQQ